MLKLEPARRRKTPLGIVPTGANAVAEARAPAIIEVRSIMPTLLSRLNTLSDSYISAVVPASPCSVCRVFTTQVERFEELASGGRGDHKTRDGGTLPVGRCRVPCGDLASATL